MSKPLEKEEKKKLKHILFVPVEFSYNGERNYKIGQDEVNSALDNGYVVIDDFPSSSGVVFAMGLFVEDNLSNRKGIRS